MTYQSKWLQVKASLKLAFAGAVVAGLVAVAPPAHAITIDEDVDVGSFGVGDVYIDDRSWNSTFGNDILDITYNFTASGDSSTNSTATSLNPDPTIEVQSGYGIANLILTWLDGAGDILSQQQFTNANGVLNTSVALTQVLTNTKNFSLQLTGTLLEQGGGYITRVSAVAPIPLPAGLLLFLSGLAGVGFLGRYKAKRHEPAVA